MFGQKKRKRERLEKAEALRLQEIAERNRQYRAEAIAVVRSDVHNALGAFAHQAIRMVTLWHSRVVTTLQEKVSALIGARMEEVEATAQARFTEIVEQSKARLPSALILQRTRAFRQDVLRRIKTDGTQLFAEGLAERTDDLISAVSAQLSSVRGVGNEALPSGTRFFFTGTNGIRAYVIEQLPMVRTIAYGSKGHKNSYKRYRLAFPFVVFVVLCAPDGTPTQLHAYFRNEPLRESTDELFFPALSNVHSDGLVCLGYDHNLVQGMTFSEKIEFILETFWGSGFNNDLNSNLVSAQQTHQKLKTFEQWARESKKDSQFVLSLAWGRTHFRTLGALISSLLNSAEVIDEQAQKRQIVAARLQDFAQRAGTTLAESASVMVSAWKLEDAPSDALVSQLTALAEEGHRHIHEVVSAHITQVVGAVKDNEDLIEGPGSLKEELEQAMTLRLQQEGFLPAPVPTREVAQ